MTRAAKEKLFNIIKLRWQHIRLWAYSMFGVLSLAVLSDVIHKRTIVDAQLHLPSATEVVIAGIVAFIATLLDDSKGGDRLQRNTEAWRRMKRNAFIIGLAALGTLSKLIGGTN